MTKLPTKFLTLLLVVLLAAPAALAEKTWAKRKRPCGPGQKD